MDEKKVNFCWLISESERSDLHLPRYATSGAAGMDVQAAVSGVLVIKPGETALVPTGFAVALPPGYEFQVRPRSGLAIQFALTLVNSPGTIDADYRGEIKIALINLGRKDFTVHRGDRIAQLVLAPVTQCNFHLVEMLEGTSRASGGFGHTGF